MAREPVKVILSGRAALLVYHTLASATCIAPLAVQVLGLAGLLKSGFFSERERPLSIMAPSGGGVFPGMSDYMRALFDPERGAYRNLSGSLS